MHILRAIAVSALMFCCLGTSAWAIDPHRLISQYGHTAWRTQDGFIDRPSALTQTTDGYIWVGTSSGLVRFDGVTFTHWTPPGGEPLPFITDLLGARDGSLWIGTAYGLLLLKNGVLSNYEEKRGAPGISAIIEDHNGTIWVTRYQVKDGRGPLCRVTGAVLQCFGKNDGIPGRYGLGLAEDSEGNIWFGCQALCRWAPGSSQVYFEDQFKNTSGNGVSRVAIGPSRTAWATLEGTGPKLGVQHFNGRQWSSYVVPGFDGRTVVSEFLFVDSHQTLWVGTNSAGLYHIHDGFADHYGSAQGLSGNWVETISEDKEGDIWITTDRGIDSFRDFAVATFSENEGLVGAEVRSVFALGDGSVWAGNAGALDIIRPRGVSAITTGHGLPGQTVEAIFKDSAGRMWLGIDKKLMTYEQGRFVEAKKSDGSPAGLVGRAAAFAQDIEGNLWVLTYSDESGQRWLLRIKRDHLEEKIRIDELFPRAVDISADRVGGLWVLYQRGKVARYHNGRAEAAVSLGSPDRVMYTYSSFVDSYNVLWFATSEGLYRFNDGAVTLMDSRNGLPCSAVYSVIEDNGGAFWLYTRCGLVKISKSDLANWLKSPESKLSVRVYDAFDGAQPDVLSDAHEPVVAKSPDGRLWFASNSFVQIVDPVHPYTNTIPPPVRIEDLVADHRNHAAVSNLKLPPLSNDLEISYTALSFTIPRRVLFRYKLEGHDQQWQEAGTRRQAFYNDLSPGHYRFRVIACNNDGIWNDTGATLDFSIAPAWFQTKWFLALSILSGLMLVWALFRLRMQQMQKSLSARFNERLAERTRIARDLHDTFVQTIQGSKLVADDALEQSGDPVRMHRAMEQLSVWLGQATQEGRAALNSLRASTTQTNDLAEAFRRVTEDGMIPRSITVTFSVAGDAREMHPIVRDEIFRIGYEAIRNACTHSGARQLEVEIKYADDLTLRVKDNGGGMDPDIAERGKDGHFGISGMRERADRIRGKLTLVSFPHTGTEVRLVVPGDIIFRPTFGAPITLFARLSNWFARMDRK